jgi:hypothetical protein
MGILNICLDCSCVEGLLRFHRITNNTVLLANLRLVYPAQELPLAMRCSDGARWAIASTIIMTCVPLPVSAYTWPDAKLDHMEALYFQQGGHGAWDVGARVRECQAWGPHVGPRDSWAISWIRTVFHDVSTADVDVGTGGLDGSIAYELDRPENVGSDFLTAIKQLVLFISARSSFADVLALGAVLAVASCTNSPDRPRVWLPLRVGRIDATEAGPRGTPQPHETLDTHKARFAKMGFTPTEMISLVACGHSLGSVSGADFPDIVPPGPDIPVCPSRSCSWKTCMD